MKRERDREEVWSMSWRWRGWGDERICERLQRTEGAEKEGIKLGTAFVHTEYGLLVKLIRFYKL